MDGEEIGTTKRGRGRGRGTRGRGVTSTRGRGRKAKAVTEPDPKSSIKLPARTRGRKAKIIESDEEASPEQTEIDEAPMQIDETPISEPEQIFVPEIVAEEKENEIIPPTPTIDMEADISQLEAPTFTTIIRGPPEPMLRLKWDHKVSLIGEKVMNPMIHCCDQCDKPILIYGRMIPCKHVFCLRCARIIEPFKACARCKEKVLRVEQSGLGTVFMCTHGGSRYGNTGCRRTYLSQRDLQAHINHRHITMEGKIPLDGAKSQRKGSISNDSMMQSPYGQQSGSVPLNLSQSATHNLPVTSSTSYYSSFSQYGSMQSQHISHYSNASRNSAYDSGGHKSNLDSSRR